MTCSYRAARTEEMRNTYKIFAGEPEGREITWNTYEYMIG
jgi:hypothetical protein